jgi:CRP-like cAMP-binding protein
VAQGEVLFEPERPIDHVYFPETAVFSLVSTLHEGGSVEVGTVGCEGMAGLPVFLSDDTSSARALAQIAGAAARMEAAAFRRLASAPGPLHRLLLRYTQAFLTQVAQTAARNGAHLLEERCARWLLMTHDGWTATTSRSRTSSSRSCSACGGRE